MKVARRIQSQAGQAVIEYVLILAIVMSVMVVLNRGLQTSIRTIWVTLAKEIAAPCPKCEPPRQMR
jgi:Flp pilus assembly pilin Flp